MKKPTPSAFGPRLKALRVKAGLTQAALGKVLGIHPVCISQYEAGVNVPREERKAAILAHFEQGPAPAADPPAKKRGRPRKVTAEEPMPQERKKRRVKWGRPKKVAEVIEQKVVVETRSAQSEGAGLSKSPARLGVVNQGWVEQQVASYVHARGTSFADGQACVVVLRKRDIIDLGQTLIEACGTKVSGEGA